MTATYSIPACNLSSLQTRIEALNKRARKIGCKEVSYTAEVEKVMARVQVITVMGEVSKSWMEPEKIAEQAEKWPCTDTGKRMEWFKVTVEGETPKINGWSFVATLEPLPLEDGTTENVIQAAPGLSCPPEYRKLVGTCDHCKRTRKRNQTFVLKSEEGTHKVVGRQCLKDFLGYNGDPHAFASEAELLGELTGLCEMAEDEDWSEGGYGRSGEQFWDLHKFLMMTAGVINNRGWVSRTTAREDYTKKATADRVVYLLEPPGRFATEKDKKYWKSENEACSPSEKEEKEALEAMAWVKELPASELEGSDYLANLNLVARSGIAGRKTVGLAASLIVAYWKAMEKEIQRQQYASRPPSVHVGTVGKRQEFTVKCERVIANESQWGTTGIHKLVDEMGNDMTWFASSGKWLEEGKTYRVKATVKDHGDYKGRAQTTITRVSVVKELETVQG